jgi:hypothetical protein
MGPSSKFDRSTGWRLRKPFPLQCSLRSIDQSNAIAVSEDHNRLVGAELGGDA